MDIKNVKEGIVCVSLSFQESAVIARGLRDLRRLRPWAWHSSTALDRS